MDALLHHLSGRVVTPSDAVDTVPLVRDRHVVGRHGKRGRERCLWQGGGAGPQEVQGHVLHLLPEHCRDGVHGQVCAVQLAHHGPSLHLSDCDTGGVPLAAAFGAKPCAHEAELVMERLRVRRGASLPTWVVIIIDLWELDLVGAEEHTLCGRRGVRS